MLIEVTAQWPNVRVDSWHGLLVDYCREHDIKAIVKGLRAVSDYDYELQMAQMNHQLTGVDTLFMPTKPAEQLTCRARWSRRSRPTAATSRTCCRRPSSAGCSERLAETRLEASFIPTCDACEAQPFVEPVRVHPAGVRRQLDHDRTRVARLVDRPPDQALAEAVAALVGPHPHRLDRSRGSAQPRQARE